MKPVITKTENKYEIKTDRRRFIYRTVPKSEDQAFIAYKDDEEVLRLSVDLLNEICPSLEIEDRVLTSLAYFIDEIKECDTCGKDKHVSNFRPQKWKYKGEIRTSERHTCKTCTNAISYEYQKKNKYYRFWKYYKLGQEAVDKLVAAGCSVCGTLEDLVVDHDHACCSGQISCGKCVRGVLCAQHNYAAGHLQDSVEYCYSLAKYLEDAENNKVHVQTINKDAKRPILPKKPRKTPKRRK